MIETVLKTVIETVLKTMLETVFKTMIETVLKKRVRNHVRKIKNIVNKNMSILKITDPKKRDFIVNEFLTTSQNIQQNFLSFTDMQKDLKEGLVSELKPIGEGMKNLPKTITFSQFPSITAYDDDDGEEEEDVFIGDIAEQYFAKVRYRVWSR